MASKTSIDRDFILKRIEKKGQKTPLEFLLDVMNNKQASIALRVDAAKSAAPYIHRKQPSEVESSQEVTIVGPYVPTRQELAEQYGDE